LGQPGNIAMRVIIIFRAMETKQLEHMLSSCIVIGNPFKNHVVLLGTCKKARPVNAGS